MAELNAGIINPETYQEYIKRRDEKNLEMDTEFGTLSTGVTKGLKDSQGGEISIAHLEKIMSQVR